MKKYVHQAKLLLIGRQTSFFQDLQKLLSKNNFLVRTDHFTDSTVALAKTFQADAIIVCSSKTTPLEGISTLEQIRSVTTEKPLFLVARHGSEEKAVAALRSGVSDYFSSPKYFDDLCRSIRQYLHNSLFSAKLPPLPTNSDDNSAPLLAGNSHSMKNIRNYLTKVAKINTTVLITGETGTGKGLAVNFMHHHSQRNEKSLVLVNSSAMPEQLVDSELFGYEKGAFTGASSATPGKFEQAESGTLFIDEIGDLSLLAQAKILRAMQTRRVQRLGGPKSQSVNVRIVAATNQDLEHLVDRRQFRKDLYFRLNVARIHLPPLRGRKEDIPLLLSIFIDTFNKKFDRNVSGFSERAWFCLLKHEWPGNIRELKNVIEATYINEPLATIRFSQFPLAYQQMFSVCKFRPKNERDMLLSALFANNWNKSKAAEELNWSRMTIYRKIAKHKIVHKRTLRDKPAPLVYD